MHHKVLKASGLAASLGEASMVSFALDTRKPVSVAERAAMTLVASALRDRMPALFATNLPVAAALSARERDCMTLVAEGKSDADIAGLLGIALPTVATHMKNARLKLGAKTRAQAVGLFLLTWLL